MNDLNELLQSAPSGSVVGEESLEEGLESQQEVLLTQESSIESEKHRWIESVDLKKCPWVPAEFHSNGLWVSGLWKQALLHHQNKPTQIRPERLRDAVAFYLRWLEFKQKRFHECSVGWLDWYAPLMLGGLVADEEWDDIHAGLEGMAHQVMSDLHKVHDQKKSAHEAIQDAPMENQKVDRLRWVHEVHAAWLNLKKVQSKESNEGLTFQCRDGSFMTPQVLNQIRLVRQGDAIADRLQAEKNKPLETVSEGVGVRVVRGSTLRASWLEKEKQCWERWWDLNPGATWSDAKIKEIKSILGVDKIGEEMLRLLLEYSAFVEVWLGKDAPDFVSLVSSLFETKPNDNTFKNDVMWLFNMRQDPAHQSTPGPINHSLVCWFPQNYTRLSLLMFLDRKETLRQKKLVYGSMYEGMLAFILGHEKIGDSGIENYVDEGLEVRDIDEEIVTLHQTSTSAVPQEILTWPQALQVQHVGSLWGQWVEALKQSQSFRLTLVGGPEKESDFFIRRLFQEAGLPKVSLIDEPSTYAWVHALQKKMKVNLLPLWVCVPEPKKNPGEQQDEALYWKSVGSAVGLEVWQVKDLKHVPEHVLALSDAIFQWPDPTLAQREAFLTSYVEPEALKQAARQMRTWNDLRFCKRWKREQTHLTWSQLALAHVEYQRHIQSQKPVEPHPSFFEFFPAGSLNQGFETVMGYPQMVKQAQQLIDFFKYPAKYEKWGVKAPKGVLLTGGAGTGKTHLARAMACEASVNLLVADTGQLLNKPESIKKLFEEARRLSPCILFIDEIDVLATRNEFDPTKNGALNQLLMSLDGFANLDQVLVVGATYRVSMMDKAVRRSGRLGVTLSFEMPFQEQREVLWDYYLKNYPKAQDWEVKKLAKRTALMSPADIQQLSNQFGLRLLLEDKESLSMKDGLIWLEEHRSGLPSGRPRSPEALERTAIHEAGHALMMHHFGKPMSFVSIEPRAQFNGFVSPEQVEGRDMGWEEYVQDIQVLFAGLEAESVLLEGHGFGGESDLFQVREMAKMAFEKCGFSKHAKAGFDRAFCRSNTVRLSNELLRQLDVEEQEWIEQWRVSARSVLMENKNKLKALSEFLKEYKSIDGAEVSRFLEEWTEVEVEVLGSDSQERGV